jgi:hypothetical protein
MLLTSTSSTGAQISICHKEHEERKDQSQHHFLGVLRVLSGSEKVFVTFRVFCGDLVAATPPGLYVAILAAWRFALALNHALQY